MSDWIGADDDAVGSGCRAVAPHDADLLEGPDGKRPVHGTNPLYHEDPNWQDLVLFYEYFHGDNGSGVGASHQTGWTGVVAKLLQQSGERVSQEHHKPLNSETPELETMSGD